MQGFRRGAAALAAGALVLGGRIRSIGYNSRNPSYDSDLMAVHPSVVLHKAACAR